MGIGRIRSLRAAARNRADCPLDAWMFGMRAVGWENRIERTGHLFILGHVPEQIFPRGVVCSAVCDLPKFCRLFAVVFCFVVHFLSILDSRQSRFILPWGAVQYRPSGSNLTFGALV
jgi:hypothetical protein